MDSEKKRSDEYWMGVRDALRMVDSFTKWARRNESRAKQLDDFIHDGLVAAAKRCESCLKDDLGLTFLEDEDSIGESLDTEIVPSGYEMGSSSEDYPDPEDESEPAFEVEPIDMSPETSDVPIESESDSFSIDTVGRLEEEKMDDLSIEGPPREFSSDFDLVEPTELMAEQPAVEREPEVTHEPEPEPEEEIEEVSESDSKPSFTWADYEKAVTPEKEDPVLVDEDVEIPPPVEMESDETPTLSDDPEPVSEIVGIPEPPSIPTDEFESAPIDEEEIVEVREPPSIPTDEFESAPIDEEEDIEVTEEPEPITEPPPPPPPPDSDEDEDERRRRARRLFFGE